MRLGLFGVMTSKGKSGKERAEQMKPEELPCFQSKFLELPQGFKRSTIWTHAPFLVPPVSTAVPDRGKAVLTFRSTSLRPAEKDGGIE